MTLPDRFIEHDSQKNQLANAGLDAKAISQTAINALQQKVEKAARA